MTIATTRQHRRHRVTTDCVLRSASDDRLLADRTVDLSWSGLRVDALASAAMGERVRICVRIPGSTTWLDAEGRVTRVCPGRREGESGPTLGVRMGTMDGMHRLLLATVLRHYPEAASERGGGRDYARAVLWIADEPDRV